MKSSAVRFLDVLVPSGSLFALETFRLAEQEIASPSSCSRIIRWALKLNAGTEGNFSRSRYSVMPFCWCISAATQ